LKILEVRKEIAGNIKKKPYFGENEGGERPLKCVTGLMSVWKYVGPTKKVHKVGRGRGATCRRISPPKSDGLCEVDTYP